MAVTLCWFHPEKGKWRLKPANSIAWHILDTRASIIRLPHTGGYDATIYDRWETKHFPTLPQAKAWCHKQVTP